MVDISNYDVERLQALILEMVRTINSLSSDVDSTPVMAHLLEMEDDIDQLQNFTLYLAKIIYDLSHSSQLKGIVNSVLDCITVDEAFDALRNYNAEFVWERKIQASEPMHENLSALKLVV